jgi:hypothetical protein
MKLIMFQYGNHLRHLRHHLRLHLLMYHHRRRRQQLQGTQRLGEGGRKK